MLIVSPPDHTRVAPGDRLMVRVEPAPEVTPSAITAVAVLAEKPLGLNLVKGSLPAVLTIQVPESAPSGLYHLTALARDGDGHLLSSPSVVVDVERSLPPLALRIEPKRLEFRALGETLPVRVSGSFPGGALVDLSRSREIEFTSLDARVATVDGHGLVAATGPGSTEIAARYRSGPMTVIPVHVATPTLMIAPASLHFDPQPIGTSSTSLSVTVTNRGAEPLEITSVQATGDFAAQEDCLRSSPIPLDGTCHVTVIFTPNTAVSLGSRATSAATVVPLEGEGEARK